jgi:4-diphosphocytidyl-2-C-methyl-D-erythritol kinase
MAVLVENDLAAPAEALEPGCRSLREQLADHGAMAACVSGSGSVVFGLFRTEQEATAAAANLEGAPWTATAAVGTHPVG